MNRPTYSILVGKPYGKVSLGRHRLKYDNPSFASALQLRVSFGLLNNLPPFFSIPRLTVWFLNNLVFMV
jgi:hypothetical protein